MGKAVGYAGYPDLYSPRAAWVLAAGDDLAEELGQRHTAPGGLAEGMWVL